LGAAARLRLQFARQPARPLWAPSRLAHLRAAWLAGRASAAPAPPGGARGPL